MPARIFINYRREDSEQQCKLLYKELLHHFDPANIFLDVDNIPFGIPFPEYINQMLVDCDVMLVLINKDWLTLQDKRSGKRRLDITGDYVRVEIATALKRNIRVIPLLLNNAELPEARYLPRDIKKLNSMNGLVFRDADINIDAVRLIRELKELEKIIKPNVPPESKLEHHADEKTIKQTIQSAPDNDIVNKQIEIQPPEKDSSSIIPDQEIPTDDLNAGINSKLKKQAHKNFWLILFAFIAATIFLIIINKTKENKKLNYPGDTTSLSTPINPRNKAIENIDKRIDSLKIIVDSKEKSIPNKNEADELMLLLIKIQNELIKKKEMTDEVKMMNINDINTQLDKLQKTLDSLK